MRTKLTKILAEFAAIAALALGGAALATAGQGDSKPNSVQDQSPAYRSSKSLAE